MSDQTRNAGQGRQVFELAATEDRFAADARATTPPLQHGVGSTVTRELGATTTPPAGATSAPQGGDGALPSLSIPGYEITAELGRGGMGLVLQGRDGEIGRDVAVKVLLERHRNRPELAQRFVEEARINGQLQHPGIVPVYELGRFGDERPYFAMKLVEGRTLGELLKERKDPLDDRPKFLKIFEQICQTLAYAHARRVIHRDLKPANVMVGAFGEVQVMDWGLGKVLSRGAEDEARETASEFDPAGPPQAVIAGERFATIGRIGTPAYMPPEQALGETSHVDERSDVFGLGAILCEILTGRPPFLTARIEPQLEELRGELSDAFARLDVCGVDIDLVALAKRCLAADPADRPRDAGVLAAEVTAYLESVEARLRKAELDRAAAEVEAREQCRRRRLTLGLATAVVVVFALLGGGALWLQSQYADTERNVEAALAKAEQSHTQFRLMPVANAKDAAMALVVLRQAQAAAEEAQSVLETGVAGDELRRRAMDVKADFDAELAQLAKEERFFRELDAARMARMTGVLQQVSPTHRSSDANSKNRVAPSMDYAGSVRGYRAAFEAFGLPIVEQDLQTLSAQFAHLRPALRAAVVIALDDWSLSAIHDETKTGPPTRLLADLAQAVDDDAWRKNIRQWRLDGYVAELAHAAETTRRTPQPPESLELLARSLRDVHREQEAVEILRAARIEHADDFWIHFYLAELLQTKVTKSDLELQEVVDCYLTAVALRPDGDGVYNNLAVALRQAGDNEGALAAFHKALKVNPKNALAWFNLGITLADTRELESAVAAYRGAINADPRWTPAHRGLGHALAELNQPEAAVVAVNAAIAIEPENSLGYFALGVILTRNDDPRGAVAAYRKAIEINPQNALAYAGLANAYSLAGQYDRAVEAARRSIEIDSGNWEAHVNLGVALAAKGEHQAAIDSYEAAIAIKPRHAEAYFNVGCAQAELNNAEQAVAAYRKAVEIRPGFFQAHHNLGNALVRLGDFEGAAAAFQATVDINPNHAVAQFTLGEALAVQGKFSQAIDPARRALQVSQDPNLRNAAAQRVRMFEQLAALEARLAGVLSGNVQPANNMERLGFTEVCRPQKRYATAVRFYAEAFEDDSRLAANLAAPHRYNAACCAALAGCGQGVDATDLTDEERGQLRKQAIDWLRADLAAWTKVRGGGQEQERKIVDATLQHWRGDADLAGIRDRDELAKLPAEEQEECRRLWADVDALLLNAAAEAEPIEAP